MAGRRREHHEEHPDERWLLTYADMITLLVALFIVMFAISSINKGKFDELKKSLNEAFSGRVMPGGQSVAETGSSASETAMVTPPLTATLAQKVGNGEAGAPGSEAHARAKAAEQENFSRLKQRIDGFARERGLQGRVSTRVTEDGLQIRVLTDKLLFDSGSAAPRPAGRPLLHKIGAVLAAEARHPITVSGHTDDVPISTGTYPSNWELSVARATAVVRELGTAKVRPTRMTAAGRAQLDPIADNDSDAGRVLNRRVEILLPRLVTR